ncbi:hypothetical protein GYMLUDRAFT_670950 [Collybiopsis luxurians FD-317 M1]|uniref:Uncharacterized protein n=1 Tax=Collybiopsis luxurians FD-317 M1 TaxID=944289 RepID=A0A0D0B7U8_9AGAR|nr:hypothetical protein GYMLUDRAFT_670950 [Collybiopsis luxurians FD-317 M1]
MLDTESHWLSSHALDSGGIFGRFGYKPRGVLAVTLSNPYIKRPPQRLRAVQLTRLSDFFSFYLSNFECLSLVLLLLPLLFRTIGF